MKALVVERDPTIAQAVASRLEARGHEVTVCAGAEQAWALLEAGPTPLVILGCSLDQGDGTSLCRRLRAQPTGDQHYVLMLVDEKRSDCFEQVLEAGADDFVTTPFGPALLQVRLGIAEREAAALAGQRRREQKLRETDRRLSAVIANAPVGILSLDRDGVIDSVKGKALESFGIRAADCVGKPVYDVLGGGDAVRDSVARTLDGVSAACMIDRPGLRLEVRWSPQLGPGGEVTGSLGVVVGLGPSQPESAGTADEEGAFYGLIGRSKPMKLVFEHVREVARVDWTVLVEGETGTGKELVARAIHDASARADRPFVAVNCAGLTESLLQSQLFGHRRGAFTGAVKDQEGLFEAADGGTLFLDEIGDISQPVQLSLLRSLETLEITRVGETRPRKVDTRIVAATNRNLAEAVAEGSFRADLFYRIRIARLHLPPLRERGDDIPELAVHFLTRSRKASRKPIGDIDPVAMADLCAYAWPGNVRELKGAIEFAVLRCRGTVLTRGDLPAEVQGADSGDFTLDGDGDEVRDKLLAALKEAAGNRSKAARLMGVSRATFYRYLARLDIDLESHEL